MSPKAVLIDYRYKRQGLNIETKPTMMAEAGHLSLMYIGWGREEFTTLLTRVLRVPGNKWRRWQTLENGSIVGKPVLTKARVNSTD
jgi:hypothetical protein